MSIKKTLTYLFMIFIAGCVTPTAPKFSWGQTVDFEGYSFRFNSAQITSSYLFAGKRVTASDTFIIIDISMINKTGTVASPQSRPIFELIDQNGSTYVSNLQHNTQINWGGSSQMESFTPLNPNSTLRKSIVFEVPKGSYFIRTIVPSRLQSFKSGPYFIYDISSQL